MSIRVVCPNGHALHVKKCFAGKTGLCPICRARVEVPKFRPDELSEQAIMDILGPHAGGKDGGSAPASREEEAGRASTSSSRKTGRDSPPKKSCHVCHQEISAGVHICPHCHTYIAGLTDF